MMLPLILVALFAQSSEAMFQCLTCATTKLRADWQVTGFPRMVSDNLFTDLYCASKTDFDSWGKSAGSRPNGALVPCNDACLTMLLEFPNADGQVGMPQIVRGCSSDLVGFKSDVDPSACQSGTIKRLNSEGHYDTTRAQLHYCNTDQCNGDSIFITNPQGPTTCESNTKQVTCKQCWSVGSECNLHSDTDTCVGQWCTKSAGWIGSTWVVARGCSPYNTLGKSNTCAKVWRPFEVNTPAYFPTFARRSVEALIANETSRGRFKRGNLNYDGTVCFCEGDNCNSATGIGATVMMIVVMLSLV